MGTPPQAVVVSDRAGGNSRKGGRGEALHSTDNAHSTENADSTDRSTDEEEDEDDAVSPVCVPVAPVSLLAMGAPRCTPHCLGCTPPLAWATG